MKKFNFVPKTEPVEICGKEYSFDTGNVDWLQRVFAKSEYIPKKLEEIQGKSWNKDNINELIQVMKDSIDLFLGEGEFEVVFNSKECNRNVHYITQLCGFVMDEIKAQAGK